MTVVRVLLAVAIALVLQMALARYAVGGRWVFDLVLVGVLYAALYWGPVAGIWAGTLGGLTQDALGGGIIGVGGFAKTVVGFAGGIAGSQLIVARPMARALGVAAATVGHRLIIVVLLAAIDQDWKSLSWTAMAMETVLNATAAVVAFVLTDRLPGAIQASKQRRRPSLSRRRW